MKLKLKFKQSSGKYGVYTNLTHITAYTDDNKYIQHLKHTPELIKSIESNIIDYPEI